MTEYCPVCGGRLDKKYQTVLSDGAICLRCTAICQSSRFAALAAVKSAWEENHRRCREFKQNAVVTSMGSSYIHIDTFHQWAYLSSKKVPAAEPIVFAFSELEAYRIERKGEKIVTESKGGIGRAVVGGAMFGPAGAVVGASTAKRETTTTGGISILYVDLNLNGLKTTITLSNPPLETRSTLDSMLNAQKSCVPAAEETDKEMGEEYEMPVKNNAPPVTQPTQQPPRKRTNSLGITGFVLAVMALLMSWIPVLNVILSLPAVVFSGVGLLLSGKKNAGKGLSISGLAIGVVALFISVPYSVHVFAAYSPTDSPAKSTVTATLPPEANPTSDSGYSQYKKGILAETMDLTEEQELEMLSIFESCGIVELKEVTQFNEYEDVTSYYINDDETEHYAGVNNTIVVWVYNDTKTVEAIYFHEHDIYVDGTVVAQVSDYYVPSSLRDKYRVTAQLLVKQCLNYPDTAKFGSSLSWSFGVSEDGYDGVYSSVTAKNAFGVESTEDFRILFDRDTGEVVSLVLGGTEYIR